jgi:DNA-binding MarR family transcriptional regulator
MAAPEPRWLSDAEQRAWRAYLAANRLLMVELERGHQEHGLSTSDYDVLVRLSEAPQHRLRMWELAKGTLLEKSRLSHQITRMERAGLVRRESCTGDRRGQFAVLTDRGWETIQRVAPSHVEQVRKNFIDRLNPDQVQTLTDIFAPMAEDLREACPSDAEMASAMEPPVPAHASRAPAGTDSAMEPPVPAALATTDPE